MGALNDLVDAGTRQLGYMTLNKPVLAINAGGAATVRTTNAITFLNNGIALSKAILAAQALVAIPGTTFYVQPAGKTVYYVLCLDASGNVYVKQGDYAGQDFTHLGRVDKGLGGVPDIPDGYTPFGMIKVVTGSAAFTPATTALDAANITFTFYDLGILPGTNP